MTILILTNAGDEHLPPVARRLEARGERYVRLDPASFPGDAAATVTYGRDGLARRLVRHPGGILDLAEVRSVWYRRPGVPGRSLGGRHQQWAEATWRGVLRGLWDTLDCLWLPGTWAVQEAASQKVSQLALAARLGFRIPRTVTTSDPRAVLEFYELCGGRIIAKGAVPLELPGRDGEKREPYTRLVRRRDLIALRSLRHAPVIFQEYVPKRAELRVTVVGERVFAAEIDSQASARTRHDWRHYDDRRVRYSVHALPPELEARCVALTHALGLSYGAIDLILTPDGEYVFLEINSNGQWLWVEELTKLPIADAIAGLLAAGAAPNAAVRAAHSRREAHAFVPV
jgi:hypothetical protein